MRISRVRRGSPWTCPLGLGAPAAPLSRLKKSRCRRCKYLNRNYPKYVLDLEGFQISLCLFNSCVVYCRQVSPGVCSCSNAGSVCSPCGARAAARAPRAGTQGFRPPEVLLKSPRQGPAVDTWAAGVVLASMLTARYPFFRASDDASALAELADLLGTLPLQRTAASLGTSGRPLPPPPVA